MALRADDIDLDRDRALVEAWQAGDPSAFDELYRLYFDRVRAYCQRRVGSHTDAEEIAQEAFTKALQALPRFSGERRFYPWMTVIAGRLCVDHHRRRARVEPSDEVDPGAVDDGHDERLARRIDLANLGTALGRLGPRHREVLDLRERDGLSYNEIAETLAVPHSTVEALLFRARRALRKEFLLVSSERLAALPVLGWALHRLQRARDRFAAAGVDLASLGAPIAAGAMTAALLVLPQGPGANTVPLQPAHTSATHLAAPAPPATEIPRSDAGPTIVVAGPPPASTRANVAGLTPMSEGEAHTEATQMPVNVGTGDYGAGIDLGPLVTQLVPTSGRKLP